MQRKSLQPAEIAEVGRFLRSVRIFGDLNDEHRAELARAFVTVLVKAKERIIREGDMSGSFFIIREGFVAIVRGSESGGAFISTLGPGEYFGEAALFHNARRIANVDAQGDANLLEITKPDFENFLDTHPVAANQIFKQVLKQLFLRLEKTTHELQFERRQALAQDAIDQLFS